MDMSMLHWQYWSELGMLLLYLAAFLVPMAVAWWLICRK